jgi:RNA polymerase sigma-70 factor (sigma-E family)
VTFEEFLDAELNGLDRYCRVLVGDRQLAHDCLADALIKVQVRWKKIAELDNPLAYVRRVVTNTFLDQRRSWAHRMLHLVSTEQLPEQPAPSDLRSLEDRAQLHGLLQQLPRQQRAAIVMRHYLDLPDTDIADALSCTVGSVRTYISRGLAALRLLSDDTDTADPPHRRRSPAPLLPHSGTERS